MTVGPTVRRRTCGAVWTTAAARSSSSRLRTFPPKAAWSTPPPRSAPRPGRPACCTCSTPASPSARCRSTSRPSAATSCPRPGASSCAARAAPDSSTRGADVIERLEPPFLDLHAATWTAPDRYEVRADARRFENWETNYAAKIGLGVAVDYALSWGLDAIEERVTGLAEHLRNEFGAAAGCAGARPGSTPLRHRHLHPRRGPCPTSPATALRAPGSTSVCLWSTTPASTYPRAACPISSVPRSTTTTPPRRSTGSSAPCGEGGVVTQAAGSSSLESRVFRGAVPPGSCTRSTTRC